MKTPDVLLILGTDASGKNHIANIVCDILENAGYSVEKREGSLCAKPTDAMSSEDKSRLRLLKEQLFITGFRYIRFLVPIVAWGLMKKELLTFRKSDKKVIVISHTPIRVLAFYLGHIYMREKDVKMPGYLDTLLKSILPATGVRTIVLDIDDDIRKARVALRVKSGKVDYFDQYMAKHAHLSERIESFLVWLAKTYLNAVLIENNDPDEKELIQRITAAFS